MCETFHNSDTTVLVSTIWQQKYWRKNPRFNSCLGLVSFLPQISPDTTSDNSKSDSYPGKGWLQTVKLRPLVEIKLARPIRSQYFRFSINKPQDQSFFFLVQKHHVWTVLICFSNLKCGDKSVTVETGDVSWGEGRSYLLFLIVDEWNITWSRPYLITFFVKHCVQIHDSWRFQGILELPMWTT